MQTDHIPASSALSATASPWGGPDDVLDGLTGAWALERVIAGAPKGSMPMGSMPMGSMRGSATFRRLDSGLIAYREEGRLQLPGGEAFEAFRDYLYDRVPAGFAVSFAETPPRLFHEIRLRAEAGGALVGVAEHLCGRDHYATRYAFQPDGRFAVHHDVRGPRKDYAITTLYARPLPRP
jgi:hypothetical protein